MRYHRNLHNAKRGGPQWVRTERGRVAEYLETVELEGVTTRLQPAGVRKCQERNVRSVCAFLDGEPTHQAPPLVSPGWEPICFDPRVDQNFRTPEGLEWNAADYVILASDGRSWAYRPRWEA